MTVNNAARWVTIPIVAASLLGCRGQPGTDDVQPFAPVGAVAAAVGAGTGSGNGSGEPQAAAADAGFGPRRFAVPTLDSPFDAGRIVAIGAYDDQVVLATLDSLRGASPLRVFSVDASAIASEAGRSTREFDVGAAPTVAVLGDRVVWAEPVGQGIEFGTVGLGGGAERSGRVELAGLVGSAAAAWCGDQLVVCGGVAGRSVHCATVSPGIVLVALPLVEQPQVSAGLGDGVAWPVAGGVFVAGGEAAVTVIWLAEYENSQRPVARVFECTSGAVAGDVVDLAGEAWTPRDAGWGRRAHAIASVQTLAWVLPSGVDAAARAGAADLMSGASARQQIDPTESMTERPLLFASRGRPLFVYDAVGRDGERTYVRWTDGVATQISGRVPLDAADAQTARLAASGGGFVALVVARDAGAEVVLLAADAFTRAQ